MFQIREAILALEKSLNANPTSICSWNLLALLLSARKDYKRALAVCDAGWKEGISIFMTEGDETIYWDIVDLEVKEELCK